MTVLTETSPRTRSWSLPLRYALREMRGGLNGFYVFIACIALGVMAIMNCRRCWRTAPWRDASRRCAA
jgi:predicted lysophospholipase L1 biosynthesis ABC-type transport system permease subunit